MEVWSFGGLFNGPKNVLTEPNTGLRPWPHMNLWWDGDELAELYNDGKIEKWDWNNPKASGSLPRITQIWSFGGSSWSAPNPQFIGDILGDWREEVIVSNADFSQLVIFTTNIPSNIRLYTLSHNPAYRNAMTLKGYMQSHHVDYFLGSGMTFPPPRPNIRYAGTAPNPSTTTTTRTTTPGGVTTTTSRTTTTTSRTTTTGGSTGGAPLWGQCGYV